MSTLSELYLGAEPVEVGVEDDRLVIRLTDGRKIGLPLRIASQLSGANELLSDTEIVILRHPPQIDHVHVTDSALNVYLEDGRLLSCPLAWFPRLLHGTAAERNLYELSGDDDIIHWPALDEDVELSRLFEGGRSVESERSIQRWLLARQAHLEA